MIPNHYLNISMVFESFHEVSWGENKSTHLLTSHSDKILIRSAWITWVFVYVCFWVTNSSVSSSLSHWYFLSEPACSYTLRYCGPSGLNACVCWGWGCQWICHLIPQAFYHHLILWQTSGLILRSSTVCLFSPVCFKMVQKSGLMFFVSLWERINQMFRWLCSCHKPARSWTKEGRLHMSWN